ncbi:MAG: TIM barrel protein [Ignavibacteriales bacterium]|nr:TIM barrel protein [Ignavibacteriales bacterium]
MYKKLSRKEFIKLLTISAGALSIPGCNLFSANKAQSQKMKLGLVTYLWGKDWDIPTLITNCTKAEIFGVELRIEHAHGVNLDMSKLQRDNVKNQFQNSDVKILGMGTNQQFDYPDPAELKNSIEVAKEYIKLSYDIGGSGVKVKPNRFHENVPKENTIEQIGKSLNEIGKFGADYNQQIRLEVHGRETQELPNIKKIMDVADHPNVTVCWNSNPEDLLAPGLEHNFNLVKNRLGDTVHVRELNSEEYPYQELINLFKKNNYNGWILLECRTDPEDKVKALIEQRNIWEKMLS